MSTKEKAIVPAPQNANIMDDLSKKIAFKKFSWRGRDINQMIQMKMPEFA